MIKKILIPLEIVFALIYILAKYRYAFPIIKQIMTEKIKKHGIDSEVRIAYFNYSTKHQNIDNNDWFFAFIKAQSKKNIAVSWYKPQLIISAVSPKYDPLKWLLRTTKTPSLFFIGENLCIRYKKHRAITELADFSLGFKSNLPDVMHFPLWILYIFTGDFVAKASLEDVQNKLVEMEKAASIKKHKFAAMIANHNCFSGGVERREIVEKLNLISKVDCAGEFLHNDDILMKDFNDDKIAYLKDFIFNICPENSKALGYVTEKIFDSCISGCIPIYWGYDNPEPKILNYKRIIFWDKNGDNIENLKLIEKLYKDKHACDVFLSQNIFLPTAAVEIHNYFLSLRVRMASLLNLKKVL